MIFGKLCNYFRFLCVSNLKLSVKSHNQPAEQVSCAAVNRPRPVRLLSTSTSNLQSFYKCIVFWHPNGSTTTRIWTPLDSWMRVNKCLWTATSNELTLLYGTDLNVLQTVPFSISECFSTCITSTSLPPLLTSPFASFTSNSKHWLYFMRGHWKICGLTTT